MWSADLAYAVGLTATDGCLCNDRRHLAFDSADMELIEIYARCVGHQVRPRRDSGGGNSYQMQYGDVALWDWFVSIGLSPRKSLTLGALDVPDEFLFHVVRGLFDGDGTIRNFVHAPTRRRYPNYLYERLVVRFTSGSRAHLDWLRSRLASALGLGGSITHMRDRRRESGGSYYLQYAKRDSERLLVRLYVDSDGRRLERKWRIWDAYLRGELCRRRDSNPHGLAARRF